MRFDVEHTTTYTFDRAVFLEPHTIRLRPRSDPWQRLEAFEIDLDPAPQQLAWGIDRNGNAAGWCTFTGTHERLTITTRCAVETLRANPFDYLIPTQAQARLPMDTDATGPVADLARSVAEASDHDLVTFLAQLTQRLYEDTEVVVRPEGDPFAAERTLESGCGSCRDLAVLYSACCDVVGVPSRFVSGYQEGDPGGGERDLHAWTEAYVPGGGWRPYDPTHGLAVADQHVALAAAPHAADAAPVTGSFRGTDADATMEARVLLRTGTPEGSGPLSA